MHGSSVTSTPHKIRSSHREECVKIGSCFPCLPDSTLHRASEAWIMDHGCVDLLASLGEDLQLEVIKVLQKDADKDSMQAVLQTSRDLRLRASALIHKLVVCNNSNNTMDNDRFPRHAVNITSLELRITSQVIASVVEWLNTAALTDRLLLVTRADLVVQLPRRVQQEDEDEEDKDEKDFADAEANDLVLAFVVAALAHACPNLSSLVVSSTDLFEDVLSRSFFEAIGAHLPNLTQLEFLDTYVYRVPRNDSSYGINFEGIDWAACLPAGLTKLHLWRVALHRPLLQQLLRMLLLVDVKAWSISTHDDDLSRPVQSDACAWRKLQLGNMFPDFREVCRFSTWPSGVKLVETQCLEGPYTFHWKLGRPSVGQTGAVATAAQRLSTCDLSSSGTFKLSWHIGVCRRGMWQREGPQISDDAAAAGIISALAPLAGSIPALWLDNWPVSASLLDELAWLLPYTHTLIITDCTISEDAWARLLRLPSVTAFSNRSEVPMVEALAPAVQPVPQSLSRLWLSENRNSRYMSYAARDRGQASWNALTATLSEQRIAMGLPPVVIADPHGPE